MFIPFKDENGSYGVRPMYIGFIKNNLVRRALMILLWPLTLTVTFSLNYLMVLTSYVAEMIRLTIRHVIMATKLPWHDKTWGTPRRKSESEN